MSTATYYEALGVHRTASINTIQSAYCKILQENHPDVTRYQYFRLQAQADKRIRAASAAWQVLSNIFTRRSYDESLPPENPFNHWASTPGNTFGSSPPRNTFGDTYAYPSEQQSTPPEPEPEPEPESKEAEFCTMTTPAYTVMDIKISAWSLSIMVSSTLRFTNNVSELSSPDDNPGVISFEVGLERDKASPELQTPTVNELTIKVEDTPHRSLYGVAKVQTLFKEIAPQTTSLIVTVTAARRGGWSTGMPWEFGFGFDMNEQFQTINRARGTCMLLSMDEPTEAVQKGRGVGTSEEALKVDKTLKADAWCTVELGGARVGRVVYNGVVMWRVLAVG
jgi:hypothetical protein